MHFKVSSPWEARLGFIVILGNSYMYQVRTFRRRRRRVSSVTIAREPCAADPLHFDSGDILPGDQWNLGGRLREHVAEGQVVRKTGLTENN